MAFYSITSGSGFTGNAQYYSGSNFEGISLNGITSGSKYAVMMQYRSSVPLSIYSGDYGDYHIATNNIPIPANTGSAKWWSGEFLSIAEENYIGLTATGWMELDQVRVKQIPNLVSNGTFEIDTWWTKTQAAITINTTIKKAVFNNTGNGQGLSRPDLLIVGKRYRISFEVSDYVTGRVRPYYGQYPPDDYRGISNGHFSWDFVAGSSYLYIFATSGTILNLDNVHLYEIPEWTYTGNHYCDVTLIDKYAVSQSLMLIATGSGRGSELITNGTFTTDSDWSKGAGATISGGTANLTGSGQFVNQNLTTLTVGKTYELFYTATVPTTAQLRVEDNANGQFNITYHSGISSATFVKRFTCVNSTCRPMFYHYSGSGTITVDNVSLKEVTGEVSLPSAQIDTLVSGNKYTLEGFARIDPASLTYGSDLVSGWDFTSGWVATSATIIDSNSFSTTGEGGIRKDFGSNGAKIYKCRIAGTTTASTMRIMDYGISTTYYGSSITGVSGTFDVTFYFSASSKGLHFRNNGAGQTDITAFELYEATPITLTAQLGTKSVTSSALSVVPGSFTKTVLNFEATPSEVNQDLKLYLSGFGTIFVDKLSLTQAYDMVVISKNKEITQTRNPIFSNGGGEWGIGMALVYEYVGGNAFIRLWSQEEVFRNNNTQTGNITNYSTPVDVKLIIDRTNNVKLFLNSAETTNTFILNFGKIITNKYLTIGSWFKDSYILSGSISNIQFWRFENVASSSFSTSSIGLQYPTGGGAEEVLRLTFQDSSSLANMLKDYSPKNHSVIPSGSIDLTNRIKASEFRTSDTSASALITRMSTPPSNERKYLIDTTIKNLKSTGVWNKLDCLWMMAAHHSQSATLNWIKDAHNLSLVASPTFTVDRGFQGDGVSSYIDTQYNAVSHSVNYQLNSASLGYYNTNATATNAKVAIGAWDASNITSFWIASSGSALYTGINLAGSSTPSVLINKGPLGFFVQSRTDSNITKVYIDGTQQGGDFSEVSNGIPNITTKLLAVNSGGGTTRQYSNARLAFAFIGGGLTNTDITNLTTIVENYLRTVGASVT